MKNLLVALGAALLFPFWLSGQSKITLTPDMLTNISTRGDATLLIDEQQQVGDPKNGNSTIPSTVFLGGYNTIYYPLQVMIDLKANYSLDEIYFFDSLDKDSLKIYTGQPYSWNLQHTVYLGHWSQWKNVALNLNSRYIMLEFVSSKTQIAEIVIYGTANNAPKTAPSRTTHTPPLMEVLIGANGVHNQPIDKLKCVGSFREYHNWQWDEGNNDPSYPGYPNNQYAWSPSWVSGKNWGWDFDATYEAWQKSGLNFSPCLQETVPYLLGSSSRMEQKPVSVGDDPTNPQSYEEHAQYLYQFVARYGSNPLPHKNLKLKPGQPAKSGLGYVQYVENWNEQDNWWSGRESYFTPSEMAAMCSADYDGHEGTMGSGYGAKNADPNIKLVMGGLATLNLEYIKAMKLWSDYHRSSGFPADVLNFHHYSNSGGGQDGPMIKGISPEDDSLKVKLKKIVDYRDRYLPGKEIWLSEFGYDTNPNSVQSAQPIGQNDIYEVQAQWIVRSYLEIAAAGIDRAHMFSFADVNSKNPVKFNSSGLVNEKWYNHQPKKSWYYVYALKEALTGYRFDEEIASGNTSVNVYKFFNPKSSTFIYAVWCNTSVDKKINNFPLYIPGAESATLLTLQPDDTIAQESVLNIAGDSTVRINVSERPLFVRTASTKSSSCIEINSKKYVTLYLDQNGVATLHPADIDQRTQSNCGKPILESSRTQFDCTDITQGEYLEVVSDSTWFESTVRDSLTSMTFPWTGVNNNLPAQNTFSITPRLGQPKGYHSIDEVPGSKAIICDRHVSFFRKTFHSSTNGQPFFIEMTADDDMEVYLNGNLIVRENSHQRSNSLFPSHFYSLHTNLKWPSINGNHDAFDIISPTNGHHIKKGMNEIIVTIRNRAGTDNGGFSFRMGIGNPLALGHTVMLKASDPITGDSASQATTVYVNDILPPSIPLKNNPVAYLDQNGFCPLKITDLTTGVYDNCKVQSQHIYPDTLLFTKLALPTAINITSDSTWQKSTSTEKDFNIPWKGASKLPESKTYTINAATGQPYHYNSIYEIPGTSVIKTDSYTTYFKKNFNLNIKSIEECIIQLTVDDDIEVYLNGSLLVREGDFSGQNSQAPAHAICYSLTNTKNGYQGGDVFDTVTLHSPLDLLNLNGSNEIVVAVRNGGANNVGGFSFKMTIPISQKFHYPATIVAKDAHGNTNTAYTLVQIADTIPPTIVTYNPILTPDAQGMLSLNANMFNNGSYDNTSIASMSVFPSSIMCSNAQAAYLSITDIFNNTSTTTVPLSVVSALCPTAGGKKSSVAGSSGHGTAGTAGAGTPGDWSVSAYPLPARNFVNLEMSHVTARQQVYVEIWDLGGRQVRSLDFMPDFDGYYHQQLNVSDLAAGEYFLKLRHGDQLKNLQLMIH